MTNARGGIRIDNPVIDRFELVTQREFTYPQPRWFAGQGFLLLFTKYTNGRELYCSTSSDGRTWTPDRKFAGMGGVYAPALMQKFIGMGVQFILAGSELGFLMVGAKERAGALRALDPVAYVRFASVYRNFREARDFEEFISDLAETNFKD